MLSLTKRRVLHTLVSIGLCLSASCSAEKEDATQFGRLELAHAEERVAAAKAEAHTLDLHIERLRDRQATLAAGVYANVKQSLEAQVLQDPIAVPWEAFYAMSHRARVSDQTLLVNVVLRLTDELSLSRDVAGSLLELIREEQKRLDDYLVANYSEEMVAIKSPHDTRNYDDVFADLVAARKRIRDSNESRFSALVPDATDRATVAEQARNENRIAFTSSGRVQGGVGP